MPFKNQTRSTIQNPDTSGFRIPTVLIIIPVQPVLFDRRYHWKSFLEFCSVDWGEWWNDSHLQSDQSCQMPSPKKLKYSGDPIFEHSKPGLFKHQNFNGPVFKRLGFSFNIRISNVFDEMATICQISNGRASGFQIPFQIQTICNPTSCRPIRGTKWEQY